MNHELQVELLDATKPVTVAPQKLTIYIPDELPDTDTIKIAVEAYEKRVDGHAIIYREVTLPKAAVLASFKLNGLKVEVDAEKAAQLLAMFNYKFPDPA